MTAAAADTPSSLAAATWAIRAQFFVAGGLFATWGVHVPTVKAHYGLGEQALALAMLAGGLGAVGTMTQAGRIVGRYGPRRAAIVAGTMGALAIGALLLSQSYWALLALMLVFGVGSSLMDVAVNAAASDLERFSGRTLMSGFHGMFSLGGMVGAAAGSALLARQVAPMAHLGLTAAGAAAVIIGAGFLMLRNAAGHADDAPRFALPHGVLALLGVLAALGLIAEGAMYDWSVLYMAQELHSPAGLAALAYASFSAAMAAARFGGDWIRERVAPAPLLAASAALAAVSMAAVLLIANPVVTLIGFALVGFGFANVVPVLFTVAAKADPNPAHGIAVVASVGYLGMMAGPPLIGVVAEHSSLGWGLASVVLFAGVLALASPRALRSA